MSNPEKHQQYLSDMYNTAMARIATCTDAEEMQKISKQYNAAIMGGRPAVPGLPVGPGLAVAAAAKQRLAELQQACNSGKPEDDDELVHRDARVAGIPFSEARNAVKKFGNPFNR